MPVTPSTPAQFQAAQERLRSYFGQDVVFHIPVAASYPDGTPLDPETGIALDPLQQPEPVFTEAVKKCSVVFRPLRRTGGVSDQAVQLTALGWLSDETLALIMNLADWPEVSGATEVTVLNGRWKIRGAQVDGIGALQRWVIFLEDMA